MANPDPIDVNKLPGYTGFTKNRRKGRKYKGRGSVGLPTSFTTPQPEGNPYGAGGDFLRTVNGIVPNQNVYGAATNRSFTAPPTSAVNPFDPSQLAAAMNVQPGTIIPNTQAGSGVGTGTGGLQATTDPVTGRTGTDDLNPWGGWVGGQYMPGSQALLENPSIIVRDTLKQMGFNPDGGMMDLISSDADSLQYLSMLTQGMGGLNSGNADDVFNFYHDWSKGQGTVGGGVVDPNQLLDRILNAPKGSALEGMLKNASTADFNNLVQAAVMGKSGIYRNAIMENLGDNEKDWLSDQARNKKSPNIAEYIKKTGFY